MTDGVIKIAVADDHERFRKALCTHLRRMGFEVVAEASNGQELLFQLQSVSPSIVIADLSMPVIDGLEAIRRIRSQWPELPILALSINDDPMSVEAAVNAGASRFISKGGSPIELKGVLEEMLV
jgi:DNA-binding NarL/FixJ family response regulator